MGERRGQMGNFIKWFSEVKEEDQDIIGEKAKNLAVAYNTGLPVPSGFIRLARSYLFILLSF